MQEPPYRVGGSNCVSSNSFLAAPSRALRVDARPGQPHRVSSRPGHDLTFIK